MANKEERIDVNVLVRDMESFTYRNGYEISKVFDDFLRYVIHGFSLPSEEGLKDWNYKKEDNAWFYSFIGKVAKAMQAEINKRGWYDALGSLYEAVIASKSRRSNSGQFFTPIDLCDLMTELTYAGGVKSANQLIGDPTCGSGRTLLSFNAKFPDNYYIAEDVDGTCVRMTIVNMLFHGMRGEVVWHDSLNIEPVWGVWRVNPQIKNIFSEYHNIPHIQPIAWEDSWLKRHYDKREEICRIGGKLKDNISRISNQLRALMAILTPSEEIKAKISRLTTSKDKIEKLLKQSYS